MKKIFLIAAMLLCFSITAFAQVENVARDVLNAYKNRDVELLKKHASALLKSSISEGYFKDKAVREDLKVIDSWDGKIREARYEAKNIMGANVLVATVYFADAPASDELYAVTLSNFNNTGWAIFGSGIAKVGKEEFARLSKTIPAHKAAAVSPKKVITNRNFNIEMADGGSAVNVSEEDLSKYLNKLDNDNFFIILKDGENYIQAAYSDEGYTVEYKDKDGHSTANRVLSKDETLSLFKEYYRGQEDWGKSVSWEKD